MRIVFLGGSTSAGFKANNEGFPYLVAEKLTNVSINIFVEPKITAFKALKYLENMNFTLKKGDLCVLQLGVGDHFLKAKYVLLSKINNRLISSLLKKLGFFRSRESYENYLGIVQEIFNLVCSQGGNILWIVTLQGFRVSPIARRKQRKYVRDAYFQCKAKYEQQSFFLDLNELLSKKGISDDNIHPNGYGQAYLSRWILKIVESINTSDVR
jgi:hypothetical protein